MNAWTVAEAKARLSEVISKAHAGSPQTITKNGHATVVVVAIEAWKKKVIRRGNLADFFAKSPLPGSNLKINRAKGSLRQVDL